ncbi:Ribose transport system permease protein RbsC [Paracoccus haematequi]|uniref:Ribose transport system permease protein RbsC n=1 Tax=Paracoccus haematequi TaxID=2491866 RepID=A0A3S4EQU6_9RHOB|nr:ABC transporter permease [Paracoccus haematequi]VDS07872.1 Ribose transport system permease protein RbsC [Paracoccus haematequi]
MSQPESRMQLFPIPRSVALIWVNIALSLIVAAIGLGVGFGQGMPAQQVILFTVITTAVLLWLLNYVAVSFETRAAERAAMLAAGQEPQGRPARQVWRENRVMVIAMLALLALYLLVTATVPEFRSITNLIAFLVLELILLFAFKVSGKFASGRSAFVGLIVLLALIIISSFTIDGFLSGNNVKAILLFASFLGIACIGQTMVALMGGLDLSIPFVIGSANIGLLFLTTLGVPSFVAFGFILILGGLIGLVNGLLSYKLQGQALILTLGTGFAVAGLTQILTSIGSAYGGNVFGTVPGWLSNLAAMNGKTFGLSFPPTILIWIVLAIIVIVGLRKTAYGRYIYALGGNRRSARLIGVSELRWWVLAYVISGVFAALTGALLLGWSGGGFIGVGDPYLFTTLAAVVIGGTSLLGGNGGYGATVIGVLVLQVLTSFLLGIGLSYEWQQFIFGLLILPMVALYGRSPHIRATV